MDLIDFQTAVTTHRSFRPFVAAFGFLVCLALGCGSDSVNSGTLPADSLAQSNPNAKASALLAEFDSLPADERPGWAQRVQVQFSVFQNVTDSQMKTRYESEIKPLLNGG